MKMTEDFEVMLEQIREVRFNIDAIISFCSSTNEAKNKLNEKYNIEKILQQQFKMIEKFGDMCLED